MLREPCVHDRYDKHATGEEFVRSLAVCPGGRPLTDAEALERLCDNGDGTWSIRSWATERGMAVADPVLGQVLEIDRAEALTLLLTDECGECDEAGMLIEMIGTHPNLTDIPCPSCGGRGRTLREGVEVDMRWPGSGDWVMFPASMLEGGESE